MSPRSVDQAALRRDRLATPVVTFYWLLLLGGLGLLTAIRRQDLGEIAPLWAGAITGSALGLLLGLCNLRGWFSALIVLGVPIVVAPVLPFAVEPNLWLAFLPAAACGYLVLSDRLGLGAFWFPAVIWMLSILDHVDGRAPSVREGFDSGSGVLLAGLAVLLLGFLRAREYRRIGLWRAVAAAPLAAPVASAVFREAPGRGLARAVWTAGVATLTFGLTAWVAPHLWRTERLVDEPELWSAAAGGAPCCPTEDETTQSRIREYFDLVRGRSEAAPVPGVDCRVCNTGAVVLGTSAGVAPQTRCPGPGMPAPVTGGRVGPSSSFLPHGLAEPAIGPPVPADPVGAPVRLGAPAAAAPTPIAMSPLASAPFARAAAPIAPPNAAPRRAWRPHREARPDDGGAMLRWLLTLVGAALLFQGLQAALRPLRRLITVRHLRRPFWSETVDQRVSNHWQLALIGLRDAGFRPVAGESPSQLARRVSVAGLETCATILERARHGLGLDAGDLAAMGAAADASYRNARRRLGVFARLTAWLRWPLT